MALMVPPTHPCPPFDNGLVRKGKATLAAEACAMVGSASAVEMIGLIGLVGGSGTVRAVRAIGAFDVVGTVKSVEAAELLELALTADTAFDPPPRRVASRCFASHCHGNQPPVEGRGCVGWRDRCAAWMRLTSPQGWVYGASREPTHPRPGHGQSALTLLRGRGKPTKNPLHKQRVLRCCHYVAEASSIRTCSSHPACTCGPTPRTPAVDPSCQRRCDTARWSDCFPAATASAHADCCCPRRCS